MTLSKSKIEEIADLTSPYLPSSLKEKFLSSLEDNKTYSFIINKKRINSLSNLNLISSAKKSKYDEITYYHNEVAIGNNLLNLTGSIYIMDASSSLISYYLKDLVPIKGNVCDLCSAPGGKSISLSLQREDLSFLCNDISFSRVLEMNKNFSRLGLTNMISSSTNQNKISNLEGCFDLVILDAPCSGSGMIRKNKKMINDYSQKKVEINKIVQKDLLSVANKILKKGGILSYSTCSLNIEENEKQIEEFLLSHNYEIISLDINKDIIKGSLGYHLLPGIFPGEGIYFCLLKKKEGKINNLTKIKLTQFEGINSVPFKNNYYATNNFYKEFLSLNIYSPGIKILDENEYAKYKYNHEFTLLIKDKYPKLDISFEDAKKYYCGEKLSTNINTLDDLYFLEYNKLPLGLGNKKGNNIQNLLPKRLKLNCQL